MCSKTNFSVKISAHVLANKMEMNRSIQFNLLKGTKLRNSIFLLTATNKPSNLVLSA